MSYFIDAVIIGNKVFSSVKSLAIVALLSPFGLLSGALFLVGYNAEL